MLKPLLALLLILAALSGGIYAFHGSKGAKRSRKEDASSLLRRYKQYFPARPGSTPARQASGSLLTSSRVVALIVAALVFGSAAYLGLGQALNASAGPTTSASIAFDSLSLHDDLRPEAWHSETELSKLLPSAQPAPAPAPAPEAPVVAPPPAEPTAAPAPPTPEPVVEAYLPATMPEGSFEAIICSLPWPCAEAISVAQCESGTDRSGNLDGNWASNGNHFGLFQISGIHAWRWADFWDAWSDPARNAQYAYEIWSESGWRPWSCRPY